MPLVALRIVVLEPWGWGGLSHYAVCLCSALADAGHEVVLITAREFEQADRPLRFEVLRALPMWNPQAPLPPTPSALALRLERVRKALRYGQSLLLALRLTTRRKPDIFHLIDNNFSLDGLLLLALRALGTRVIMTCHSVVRFNDDRVGLTTTTSMLRTDWGWRLGNWLVRRTVHGMIFHSESNRQDFVAQFGQPAFEHVVIPHGEYGFFQRSGPENSVVARRQLSLPEHAPIILFFGVIRRYKGLPYLLEAFAKVLACYVTARLVVAGAPWRDVDPDRLQAIGRNLGIAASIRWDLHYIPLDRVGLYFSACSMVVLPYLKIYESGVAKAALAMGRPVVVTNTGTLPQAVDYGRAGIIVPVGDAEALARAILRLLDHHKLGAQLVQHGHRLAQIRDDWSGIAMRTAQFYRMLGSPHLAPRNSL